MPRQAVSVRTLHELTLLLLIGVCSTLLAALVDKLADKLSTARTELSHSAGSIVQSYLVWTGSSLVLCALSAACVQFIGPGAAGSGIPQMKCVLAGVRIHDYLSPRTLLAKCLSLILALAGGLSIGKEGPFTHISCCVADLLLSLPAFQRINANEQLRRQALAAACAAGVAATFGAPVGGVLFSIEVTASFYSINHLWKAMFTAVTGAAVFRGIRMFGSFELFDLTNFQQADIAVSAPHAAVPTLCLSRAHATCPPTHHRPLIRSHVHPTELCWRGRRLLSAAWVAVSCSYTPR